MDSRRHRHSRALFGALLTLPLALAAEPARYAVDVAAGPLLGCLETLASAAHVRIVDASGAVTAHRCRAVRGSLTLDGALDALLRPAGLAWRRRADGTIEVVAGESVSERVDLAPLLVEGDPPARDDRALATGDAPTVLAENAMAVTRLGKPWLETAPLVSFDQIGRYAPNVYSAGQSLSIRGIERDQDFFTALRVTFDGIDLGTRLLDDDLVALDGLARLELVRGPRSFESGETAFGGAVRLETDDPTADPSLRAVGAASDADDWRAGVAASGPLGLGGVHGTLALSRRSVPSLVEQRLVPQANVDATIRDSARAKVVFEPDALPGLSVLAAALVVDGASADRTVEAPIPNNTNVGFDPFDRESFARTPLLADTHARGGALRARYAFAGGAELRAHGSVTTIEREEFVPPAPRSAFQHLERRRRQGLAWRQPLGADTTFVVDVTHSDDYTLPTMTTRSRFRPRLNGVPLRTDVPVDEISTTGATFETDATSTLAWLERGFGTAWRIGAGVRWQHERVANRNVVVGRTLSADCTVLDLMNRPVGPCVDFITPATQILPGLPVQSLLDRVDTALPLATVEWRPAPDHTLVFGYGHGYRSGGNKGGNMHYLPERSRNTELAWRARWAGGRLRTTATLFDMRLRDRFTFEGFSGSGRYGTARSRGVELEAEASLGATLRLRGGVGLLDAKYGNYNYGGVGNGIDGEPLAGAPSHTYVLGVRWGRPFGWYASLDGYRAAEAESGVYNFDSARRPGYTLLDVRAGYRAQRWEADVTVSNALDEDYFVRSDQAFGQLTQIARYRVGDPRRVELRFAYTWD